MAGFSFKITRNDISPTLTRAANAAKYPEKAYRAGGTTLMSITMGTFNDAGASYRPRIWKEKKDGSPSYLQKSRVLSLSFHLDVGSDHATVSNSALAKGFPYGVVHQFGSTDGKTPPRPFFPVENGKLTPKAEEKIGAAMMRAIERQVE